MCNIILRDRFFFARLAHKNIETLFSPFQNASLLRIPRFHYAQKDVFVNIRRHTYTRTLSKLADKHTHSLAQSCIKLMHFVILSQTQNISVQKNIIVVVVFAFICWAIASFCTTPGLVLI